MLLRISTLHNGLVDYQHLDELPSLVVSIDVEVVVLVSLPKAQLVPTSREESTAHFQGGANYMTCW
jgi:hypothetical protein